MSILTTSTLTFVDLNEIYIDTNPPANPTTDQIWFDTLLNVVKKYNSSSKKWEIVNDYTEEIKNAIDDLQVSGRNLLANTSFSKDIQGTGKTNVTGGEYNFVNTITYSKDIKGKEITLAFDWEMIGDVTPTGTFKALTLSPQNLSMSDIITVSNTNYYGTSIYTTTIDSTTSTNGIYFRTDNMTGTLRITHPRLFYGSKDLGWNVAPEDTQAQFETIIDKQADGIYISVQDKDKNIKTLVDANSNSVIINSTNIDLNGYVTISSLSDPNSKTTIDGNLIETDTLSANKIKTGKLQGKNSNSYFNLDDGTFKLANSTNTLMTFNGTSLTFENNVDFNLDKDDFIDNLAWIKSWTEGSTTINNKQVMSPRAFFGTVTSDGVPTGVSIGSGLGNIYETGYQAIDKGVAGYLSGKQTFRFSTDGSVIIGKEGDRQIKVTNGILYVPTIKGEEISAYNLNIFKRTKSGNTYTNTTTKSFSVGDLGDITLIPTSFVLYNGETKAISLENGIVGINADNINSGTLTASYIALEGLTTKNGGFKIDETGKMFATGAEISGKVTLTSGSTVPTSTLSGSITSSQLDTAITSDISKAKTDANSAVSTANSANSTANNASKNANSAVTTANSAVTTANNASKDAGNAVTTANNASKDASSAVSTANAASNSAGNAVTTANNALNTVNNLNIGGTNLLPKEGLKLSNSATGTFDKATNTWTLVAPKGSGTWGSGLAINDTSDIVIPYGQSAVYSFEIKVPKTISWNTDVNNVPVSGTAWGGNDNDNSGNRKTSNKNISSINQWVKCWSYIENTNSKNTDKVDIKDANSNFGIVTTNETSDITYYIRNFKFELGNKATGWSECPKDSESYVTSTVNSAVETLEDNLQSQIDGKIETWSQSSDPSTNWTSTDLKNVHKGDIWYNTSSKSTSRWNGTKWEKLTDADATNASALASKKAQIFTSTPTVPYYVGDLWITSLSSGGVIKTCKTARTTGSYTASEWIESLKYTDNTVANAAKKTLDDNSSNWGIAYNQIKNWASATPTGTTTFDGNKIKTGTILAEKLAISDFTNYAELNSSTLSKWGFSSVTDSSASKNPWFKKNSISRDNQISKWYTCEGGETFRISADISTTIYGHLVSDGSDTAVGLSVGVMIFTESKTGSKGYLTDDSIRATATSTSTAVVKSVNGTISLGNDVRSFAVYIQLNGYAAFSGELKVRNVRVNKMYNGELIVDGSIQTHNIESDAITSELIAGDTVNADHIQTKCISSDHINVNGEGFTFYSNKTYDSTTQSYKYGDEIFSIKSEDGTRSTVAIKPNEFLLTGRNSTNTADANITLKDNVLTINANAITTGVLNADLITSGTLDTKVIGAKSIKGSQINAEDFTVYNNTTGKSTFAVKGGKIYVSSSDFIVTGEEFDINSVNANNSLTNELNKERERMEQYIRFNNGTIELGEISGNYKASLSNNSLTFYEKNSAVSWIKGNTMYMTNNRTTDTFIIGPETSGSGYYKWDFLEKNKHLNLNWFNN